MNSGYNLMIDDTTRQVVVNMWSLFNTMMGVEIEANHDSIYEHVKRHVNPDGPGLLPGGEKLPDDERYSFEGDIDYKNGARDIITGHPGSVPTDVLAKRLDVIIEAFRKATDKISIDNIDALTSLLNVPDTLALIDHVLQRLINDTEINQTVLYNLCRHLFLTSDNRGVVKFCTGIMGLYGVKSDLELFKTIARHEEFTLYATVAVILPGDRPARHWMDMIKNVKGWGRIHLVNRLVDVDDEKVKEFLLKQGCRNDIMEEYTACTIARALHLGEIMSEDEVDEETFDGASVMMRAMADSVGYERPFEGLDRYRDSERLVREYLKHAKQMASRLDHILAILALEKVLKSRELNCKGSLRRWSKDFRKEALLECAEIISESKWKNVVKKDLQSEDIKTQLKAIRTAELMGVDMEEELIGMLKDEPHNDGLWFLLLKDADGDMIDRLTGLAEEKLLKGKRLPADSRLIIPADSDRELCIDFILQRLLYYPGKGRDIIKDGLNSALERNCLRAIRALYGWKVEDIEEDAINRLRVIAENDEEPPGISAVNLLRTWGV